MKVSRRHRTALVTGAGAGLGAAFAAMLVEEGVAVWGTSRDPARPLPAGVRPIVLELTDGASVERAWHQAEGESGGIDLLINNAGAGRFGPFLEATPADWERQFALLLLGPAALARLAARAMAGRGRGCVVNVSSLAAEFPIPFMAGYSAAKAALSSLGRSLLLELPGAGVTVIDFRPGDHRTDFNAAMAAHPHPVSSEPRVARVWRALERTMRAAPPAERAARDLRRALRRGRGGTVRSGSFFQARLAPFLDRLAPEWLRLAVIRRYFDAG